MQIDEIMTKDIKTVSPQASAQEAAQFMLDADTGSIAVTDNGKLVGIVTDRDLAVRGLARGKGADCSVADLMSQDPVCIQASENVEAAALKMNQQQVRRLPVVGENQELVGVVSLGDLSRQTEGQAANVALEGVSEPSRQHQQA